MSTDLTYNQYQQIYTNGTSTTQTYVYPNPYSGGYTCSGCGSWVLYGAYHQCVPCYTHYPTTYIFQSDTEQLKQIKETLTRIESLLEKLVAPSVKESEEVCGDNGGGCPSETPNTRGSSLLADALEDFKQICIKLER